MRSTLWLIVTALAVASIRGDEPSADDSGISKARQARSRQLFRFCHTYLEQAHNIGCSRIEHDLEVDVNESKAAIQAALIAAKPFLSSDTDQPVSDLAQRAGLDVVQRKVGEYIAASTAESADPTFRELVRAHRAWRLITNVNSDALARVLLRNRNADIHVLQAKTIMDVVGREAFVLPVLARALSLRQRSDLPRTGAQVDQYDAVQTVREHLPPDSIDQTLFTHLVEIFEERLPPVLKKRAPDVFAAGTEFLARLWFSGIPGLKLRGPCVEQFVLGFGLSVADYLLANDPVMQGFAEQSSRDLLSQTLPFDQMFDKLMIEVKSKLDSLLPNHIHKSHLISIIMEIFSDLERPRYLLQWLNEPDPSQRNTLSYAKQILFTSIEPILGAVLDRHEV